MMSERDKKLMRIALDCARRGRGAVEPNPMVGAVLVRDGVELARGRHEKFGGPHAERQALAAARSAGRDARGATMYVTLEPCCHHGKTPPCTDALIEVGIARVVVAMPDPDANVAGRGIEQLRGAGVEVMVGVCEPEARELLGAYVKLRTQGQPWVICKWAQTADGYLALPPGEGRWVSGRESREFVHELRGLCDGILVGVGTVLADDPLLTNRSGSGRQPVRVVLDSRLRIPADSQLVRTADESPVIVATARKAAAADPVRAEALCRAGVELLSLPVGEKGLLLAALLDELGGRRWTYLLVEGGLKVLESFIHEGLADELLVFTSPQTVADAEGLPRFDIADVLAAFSPRLVEERRIGDDTMQRFLTA